MRAGGEGGEAVGMGDELAIGGDEIGGDTDGAFLSDVEALMVDDDTALVSFDNSPLTDFLRDEGYDVQEYPYVEYQNSYIDNHWNARGNREFAEWITPFVRDLMTTRCEDA